MPLALDCLYVHVAIGRLLQLPGLSSEMEERCMRILFPTSYEENKDKFNISLFQSQGQFLVYINNYLFYCLFRCFSINT